MSDFLTNLVTRSFASTASVQPVGSSSQSGPQMVEDPMEEFSDPLVESPVTGEDFAAEAESVSPTRAPRAANRSQRREAHSEETLMSAEQTPVIEQQSLEPPLTVPGITIPPVASERGSTREPRPRASELKEPPSVSPPLVPSVSPPLVSPHPDSRSTTRETKSAKFASSPPKRSSEDRNLPDQVVGPVSKETTNEVERKLGPPPSDAGTPSRGVLQRSTTMQSSEDATTVQRAPLDPQPSIRRLLKRPGNALSLSPRISSLNTARTEPRMTEESHTTTRELGVERPPAPSEQKHLTITSLKADLSSGESPALIPKIAAQPFLPLNVRTRPIAPAREEHDEPEVAPLQETVINVAIGRIEVRATSAPAPKRERRASGPKVMNLDEYLHQRRGAT